MATNKYWTDDKVRLLMSCVSDEDLQKWFPNRAIDTLRREQRKQKEQGWIMAPRNSQDTDEAKIALLVQQAIDKNDISADDIKNISKIRIKKYQMGSKDADGEPQVTDLESYSVEVALNPVWADGPQWPLIQQAKPVNIKPVVVNKPKRKFKVAVVLPDPQIGFRRDIETGELSTFHDERAMDVALQLIRELQPDTIVNLGDLVDFAEWGKFEQEPAFQFTTQATIDRAYQFLSEQKALAPRSKIVLIEGNHDRRLQRSIIRNSMAAFGIRRAELTKGFPVLSLPHLLRLEELGVEYVAGYPASQYWINDRLQCVHGRIVRSSGSTAKAVSDAERVSTIFGHIHRIEKHYKTVNIRGGYRTNLAFTPGCLCKIDGTVPSTKGSTDVMGRPIESYENWQQGLGVVYYQPGDGQFAVDSVYIHDGSAIFQGQMFLAKVR